MYMDTEEKKEKIYVAVIGCEYTRDTQIFSPKEFPDVESEEFCELYQMDDNWKNFRQDTYLGLYKWEDHPDKLRAKLANKFGISECIISLYDVA